MSTASSSLDRYSGAASMERLLRGDGIECSVCRYYVPPLLQEFTVDDILMLTGALEDFPFQSPGHMWIALVIGRKQW